MWRHSPCSLLFRLASLVTRSASTRLDERHRFHLVRRHLVLRYLPTSPGEPRCTVASRPSARAARCRLARLPQHRPAARWPAVRRPAVHCPAVHRPAVSSIQHRRVPRAARCRPARCHRAARPHGMVHLKLKVEPLDDTALSTLSSLDLSHREASDPPSTLLSLSAALNYCESIDFVYRSVQAIPPSDRLGRPPLPRGSRSSTDTYDIHKYSVACV